MKTGRVVLLVIGCLLLIPGLGMLVGGGGLAIASATQRDDDGFFDVTIDRISSVAPAVTAENLTFASEPGSPDWLIDAVDADVRLRVTSADSTRDVFVGIARERDVDAYLAGVAHDEVIELDGRMPIVRQRAGGPAAAPPADQTFWVVSDVGAGTRTVTWEAAAGRWAVVVMHADGEAGVGVDVNAGIRADFLLPLAIVLMGVGAAIVAAAVALIVSGAKHDGRREAADAGRPEAAEPLIVPVHPVSVEARLDPDLSRWRWLVKWFLAIPHLVVLVFLWIAFVVLTIVAGVAILFTGRYPRGIFDFNVGVMRWSWRVGYYALSGGLGTDVYPPFTLQAAPGDAASLDVVYPTELRRSLVLVKWVLAIPHLVVVALLAGSSIWWTRSGPAGGAGLLGWLVLVAAVALLFTGRYPPALFALIVGLNRWIYRVVAYVALMTDDYPPFRLDQGGAEPRPAPPPPEPDWTLSQPDLVVPDQGRERVSS